MRERMRRELLKPETGFFDLKQDAGGIVDIEFLVQYLVLFNAWEHRELLRWTDNVRLLETLKETGIIDDYSAHILKVAYLTYRGTVHQHNLQEKPAKVSENRFLGLRKNVETIWKNIMKAP
jgi:glutamate-ammonia-ligase adenylyltransferase